MVVKFLSVKLQNVFEKLIIIDHDLNVYFLAFIGCLFDGFVYSFDVNLFRIWNQSIQVVFVFKLVIYQILEYGNQLDYQIVESISHTLTFQLSLYIFTQLIKKDPFQVLLVFFHRKHLKQLNDQFAKLFLVMIINQSEEKQLLIRICWLLLYQLYENTVKNYQF